MNEQIKQALSVIDQLAAGALANGLFKRFQDANAVQSAIEHIKKALQALPAENDQ